LAPNTKAEAEFAELFGAGNLRVAGTLAWSWRERNVLAPAHVSTDAPVVDLDEVEVIRALEADLAGFLAEKGIEHLDISALRSRDRDVTQLISRSLFDDGAAGLRFRSNCDDQPCIVIFEGRGALEPAGDPEPCTDDIPELLQVCSEFNLVAKRRDRPARVVRDERRGATLFARLSRLFDRY
jgi:hypothetical protein